MKNNFEICLKKVLTHEGGFSNHPEDKGGATMKGITLKTFNDFFGPKTVDDLKNITDEQLAAIYHAGYWDTCKCDDLPGGVDYVVFDAAVNSGPRIASRWLQESVGVKVDGWVGPNTIAATSKAAHEVVIRSVCDTRLAFVKRLSNWPVFGRGWEDRINKVKRDAVLMADSEPFNSNPLGDAFVEWAKANRELILAAVG